MHIKRVVKDDRRYLFVNCCHECCADLHAQHKAALEVLLEEDGLHHCHQQQQDGIQVALPHVDGRVLGEGDHQPGKSNWSFNLLFDNQRI